MDAGAATVPHRRREGTMATRHGSAEWRGDLRGGTGDLTVGDGVFSGAYSYASRFEEGEGTNPEELVAAAHAACFSMALSDDLAEAGHTPQSVRTQAEVEFGPKDGAPTLTRIVLRVDGDVPGIDAAEFERFAEQAKQNCPVSRALAGVEEIVVEARLSQATR
jgi:lipoyl-dependent peroxiredoxin